MERENKRHLSMAIENQTQMERENKRHLSMAIENQ